MAVATTSSPSLSEEAGDGTEHRTFIGLDLGPVDQDKINALIGGYSECLAQALPSDLVKKIRWTKPGNRHLTWVFLGNVSAHKLRQLQVSLSAQLASQPAVAVPLSVIGAFPQPRNPLALALSGTATAEIIELWQTIQSACAGCLEEHQGSHLLQQRNFRPHITLARFGRALRGHKPLSHLPRTPIDLQLDADNVTVFLSKLTHRGSEYTRWLRITLSPT